MGNRRHENKQASRGKGSQRRKVRKKGRIMVMKERERNVGIMKEGNRKCGQGEGSVHEIEEYI